ncbi:MAG: hypothetical protein JXB05_22315 [Myxococcaceae bacterium]|nr:hypothetical protein [Myxococcaceae bacterium]
MHDYADLTQAELGAAVYELRVLTTDDVDTAPVEVSAEAFREVVQKLAREVRPSAQPRETARWLLKEPLQADLLVEVEAGRVVRMVPLEEDSPLSAASNAALLAWYQGLCAQRYEGGNDCLGLTSDGSVLDRGDRRTLALAWAFDGVLAETGRALKEMVSPQAVFGLLVGMAVLYFTLWLVPEPVTKGLAALMTIAFIAWLGADTVWSLIKGWAQLAHDADRATTAEELKEAGSRFSRIMGDNTARVVMLVLTAAVGGGAARFSQKMPKFPGFERATVQAEAQGVRLSAAADVEAVATPAEGTFSLMVRRPGSRAAATKDGGSAITIVRHQGGNWQVSINGQRWHVPKKKSVKDIPARDPVGDELQAAAREVASQWHPRHLSPLERNAIEKARTQGEHWKAHLLESEARGRYVHRVVASQFKHLRWNRTGVDAVDPTTGYRYELLTRTSSNMGRHGRRMAEELFRMIGF